MRQTARRAPSARPSRRVSTPPPPPHPHPNSQTKKKKQALAGSEDGARAASAAAAADRGRLLAGHAAQTAALLDDNQSLAAVCLYL